MQVEIQHRNWREDPEAIERPWVILVDGKEVARVSSVNGAGSVAQSIEPDWDKIRKDWSA